MSSNLKAIGIRTRKSRCLSSVQRQKKGKCPVPRAQLGREEISTHSHEVWFFSSVQTFHSWECSPSVNQGDLFYQSTHSNANVNVIQNTPHRHLRIPRMHVCHRMPRQVGHTQVDHHTFQRKSNIVFGFWRSACK